VTSTAGQVRPAAMVPRTALGEACGGNSKITANFTANLGKCLGSALHLPLLSCTYLLRFTRKSLDSSELAANLHRN
jgi:hypothetical protein